MGGQVRLVAGKGSPGVTLVQAGQGWMMDASAFAEVLRVGGDLCRVTVLDKAIEVSPQRGRDGEGEGAVSSGQERSGS